MPQWSFLTNHGLALICISQDPGARLRDIAASLDVTERTAQSLVNDLCDSGYVEKKREGRRNHYTVGADAAKRLPLPRELDLGDILAVLSPDGNARLTR
jgi:DNA-binding MarR family transcriptional regulator